MLESWLEGLGVDMMKAAWLIWRRKKEKKKRVVVVVVASVTEGKEDKDEEERSLDVFAVVVMAQSRCGVPLCIVCCVSIYWWLCVGLMCVKKRVKRRRIMERQTTSKYYIAIL